MKCVKTANGSIMRVSDEEAKGLVDNIDYYYCSKEEWKESNSIKIRKKFKEWKIKNDILSKKN